MSDYTAGAALGGLVYAAVVATAVHLDRRRRRRYRRPYTEDTHRDQTRR